MNNLKDIQNTQKYLLKQPYSKLKKIGLNLPVADNKEDLSWLIAIYLVTNNFKKAQMPAEGWGKCLPEGYYLHKFQIFSRDAFENVYYIDRNKTTIKEANKLKDHWMVGSISTVWTEEDDDMVIKFVSVDKEYRRRGIGLYLMLVALFDAKTHNIKKVTLDDDSDQARQPRNLYTRLGFKYEEDFGPEMEADINEVASEKNWLYFSKKYARGRRRWFHC